MRNLRYAVALLAALLSSCSSTQTDPSTHSWESVLRTRLTFEPLDREKARAYIESERHTYQQNTVKLKERIQGLENGRAERYGEISREFPECKRQKHCMSALSKGDIKRFERYTELAKEINAYDSELVDLKATVQDWTYRFELRQRAILNRHLVHEILQLPSVEKRLQGILAYSLESFGTRRQLSQRLLGYAGESIVPKFYGDYDFRMLGKPVDEAAVIASFEVYLTPSPDEPEAPNRYVITLLINTHQLDLREYDQDFLKTWGASFAEPFQKKLLQEAFCGMYSIANKTLVPQFDPARPRHCAAARSDMLGADAQKFLDRFAPERWMVPIAYFAMDQKK